MPGREVHSYLIAKEANPEAISLSRRMETVRERRGPGNASKGSLRRIAGVLEMSDWKGHCAQETLLSELATTYSLQLYVLLYGKYMTCSLPAANRFRLTMGAATNKRGALKQGIWWSRTPVLMTGLGLKMLKFPLLFEVFFDSKFNTQSFHPLLFTPIHPHRHRPIAVARDLPTSALKTSCWYSVTFDVSYLARPTTIGFSESPHH